MKQTHGWWWPDHEEHMIAWMQGPKNRIKLNDRWTYQGRKQIATLKHCKSFRTAVDIGGHVGLWAFNLAHAFDRVEAFEPVADHRACFEKNLAGLGNVKLHAVALGKEPGMVSMWSEQGSSGNTQVRGEGDIPMLTLDSLELQDVDLMKIDCEGFEENVLRGAAETLKKWKPTVIVEQKRDMSLRFNLPKLGAVAYLNSLGYTVAEEISGDYIMVVK